MPVLALLAAASLCAAPTRQAAAAPPDDPLRTAADAYRAVSALAAGEPTIAEVQAAAARRAGADPAARFAGRARVAALLPRLSAEVRRDERSQRIVGLQGAGEVDYLRLSPGTVVALRATWDLGHLVAAPGELGGAAASAARARRQEEAVRRATALFYERRKLRLELWLAPPEDALARARAELDVERLGAELDALTGGLLARGAP